MVARWVEVAGLLVMAWCAAIPWTRWFAAQQWTAREPRASLLVWQAIGAVGGLAVLSAELTLAATTTAGSWPDAAASSVAHPLSGGAIRLVGLALFVVSALWLLSVLAYSFVRARRLRAEHRLLLELLAVPTSYDGAVLDVLESVLPTAYSLPRDSPGGAAHIVVSSAVRDHLAPSALRAVIVHERAHLRQRHTLLVQPFLSWERSLAPLATPRLARRRVEELIEIVCDDAARREVGSAALRCALAAVVPAGPARAERERRARRPQCSTSLRIVLCGAALVLVLGPPTTLMLLG